MPSMHREHEPNLAEAVCSALREVVGTGPVALHEPYFGGNEWLYLKECLDSTFVSSVGAFVDRFERDIATFSGAHYAVAVCNGTAALHVALLLARVQPGDEVLVPALTFVATTNAVAYCGATPHFVESRPSDLGIDAAALRDYLASTSEQRGGICINKRTGKAIRALVPMHVFGHPCDMDGMLSLARDFNLVLVEDAAESLGSEYHGRHTGTFGSLGTFSFNGNKTITTGGGGAIVTNDKELARRAKHLTTTAKVPHRWEYRHDEIGYNYRLPNLNAALGCAQLEQLPQLLSAKRALYERYRQSFSRIRGVQLLAEPAGCKSNYWLQTLVLNATNASLRDTILQQTNDAGFMTRPIWVLNHRLPAFANCPRMPLTIAESLEARVINIPSSAQLAMEAN